MSVRISVVLALPKTQTVIDLTVSDECTARAALWLSLEQGIDLRAADLDPETVPIGVFGECVEDDALLKEGDRLEIYRELKQDPKELRRQRAEQARQNKKKL